MTVGTQKRRTALVLAIDPGTTSGLALLSLDLADEGRPSSVWCDQLPWLEAAAAVESRVAQMKWALETGTAERASVVAEKFTVNPQTASKGQQGIEDAIGLRGVARQRCAATELEYDGSQSASSAKSLVKDDVLRGLGLYARGMKHVCDAYRHAVLYAVRSGLMASRYLLERR